MEYLWSRKGPRKDWYEEELYKDMNMSNVWCAHICGCVMRKPIILYRI